MMAIRNPGSPHYSTPRGKRYTRGVEIMLTPDRHNLVAKLVDRLGLRTKSQLIAHLLDAYPAEGRAVTTNDGTVLLWSGDLPAVPTLTLELRVPMRHFWLVMPSGLPVPFDPAQWKAPVLPPWAPIIQEMAKGLQLFQAILESNRSGKKP